MRYSAILAGCSACRRACLVMPLCVPIVSAGMPVEPLPAHLVLGGWAGPIAQSIYCIPPSRNGRPLVHPVFVAGLFVLVDSVSVELHPRALAWPAEAIVDCPSYGFGCRTAPFAPMLLFPLDSPRLPLVPSLCMLSFLVRKCLYLLLLTDMSFNLSCAATAWARAWM